MDSESDNKSRQFLCELAQFYRNRGQLGVTPQHLTARLDGRLVDLWQLYSAVLDMGGSFKVNQLSQWDRVYAKLFGTIGRQSDDEVYNEQENERPAASQRQQSSRNRRPAAGVNVSVALRQIYQRYLMPYERVNYSNFCNDVAEDDEEETRTSFATGSSSGNSGAKDPAAAFVIHSSLTPAPQSSQSQRSHVDQSIDPLSRLHCSLLSGLTNEMQFGLRVVTMLVNSRQIDAIADFKLVDVLLESCDLAACRCGLRCVAVQQSHRNSALFLLHSGEQQTQQQQSVQSRCLCLSRFWSKQCKDESISSLLLEDLSDDLLPELDDDTEAQIRDLIKRIADLIRTITESISESQDTDEDSLLEAAPPRLVKFAALLLSSDDSEFKSLALDIISNVNLIRSRSTGDDSSGQLINCIISHCISLVVEDNDVAVVRRAIQALTHITVIANRADEMGSAFESVIDESLINRLIELLTCQYDVPLLTAALELCWTFSETRPKLLSRSSNNKVNQLVKILLNLLNCDANTHFTPRALKHVRVSDLRNRSSARTATGVSSQVQQSSHSQQQQSIAGQQQQQQQQTQQARATSLTSSASANSLQSVVTESEAFVVSWLKSLFETSSSCSRSQQPISISEMYTDYIKKSCKEGRKNVVGAQSFSQIIGRTFPSASITSTHVDGICLKPSTPRKISPAPAQAQTPLTSPILKAHLSAPPKAASVAAVPVPSQATPTTTTLIKSLLANKLRSNSQPNVAITGISAETESKINPKTSCDTTAVQINVSMAQASNTQNILTSSPQQLIISTSGAGTIAGQAPQQFLLVRTIIQPSGNQTGVQSGSVRLILPASAVIGTHRPPAPTVSQAVTVNGNGLQMSSPPAGGQSNDILLKAVLGSGIVSDAASTSKQEPAVTNCVKSSPLLNVLLDKGKLPEQSNSIVTTAGQTPTAQSHDKVYILTTGSPIKSLSHSDVGPLKNGSASESPPQVNAKPPVSPRPENSVLTNGDVFASHVTTDDLTVNKSNQATNDLSPIKDMQKAVDEAPKLIAKRRADSGSEPAANKKGKSDENADDSPSKSLSKVIPVNGEVRVPPKPERVVINTSPEVVRSVVSQPAAVLEYVCEWHNCKQSFARPALVFKHVYDSHVFAETPAKHCQWGGPEGLGPGCQSLRPQLSLLTHLQDFHCSPNILYQAAVKRQLSGNVNPGHVISSPVTIPPPAHPGYAQNAALLAIRRLNCIEPVSVPPATPVTPITVSIRLTAALIIRNLAAVSSEVRKCLQRNERHLSEICVSPGRDESRTIAQCMALIQHSPWRR